MRDVIEIEDIEDMRQLQGIDDADLHEGIRRLRVGDFVRVTLRSASAPARGETLPVRITSIHGATFRGKLAGRPAGPSLKALAVGAVVIFTAAQIHSLARRQSSPGR